VTGLEGILEHVRLVWASLWSDAALLYRRDLELDVARSTMAVVLQELVEGDRSGVAFSQSPQDSSQAVIESVYGLNQGLVDGTVEPDRWIIDRSTGEVLSHAAAAREERLVAGAGGVRLEQLPAELARRPPLGSDEVSAVFDWSQRLEAHFGRPQDVEWTWSDEGVIVLQSRPITTGERGTAEDGRRWYLSLRRSFENLQALRHEIEEELIPGMIEEADALATARVEGLSDAGLAAEIDRRRAIYDRWVDVYWDKFIPFAHGIRLFGQVYNDALHPDDPYAFMDLLAGTEMASLARNRALERMAAMIREDAQLAAVLRCRLTGRGKGEVGQRFLREMEDFVTRFGDLSCAIIEGAQCDRVPESLIKILLEMARRPSTHERRAPEDVEAMREEYLSQFSDEAQGQAAELLDLARVSYRLRDDDNIYLGSVEAQMLVAVEEGRRRLEGRSVEGVVGFRAAEVAQALRDPDFVPETSPEEETVDEFAVRARQLIGQPAGPGVAQGRARVVVSQRDLTRFELGEILICDAVEPNMTFVVPLASAVVERRGGMLIHGAIIAREYGLPCVTGVPNATALIHTGDSVTVDGHLGIVTVAKRRETSPGEDGPQRADRDWR
jgi:pyruvate,water dikinase